MNHTVIVLLDIMMTVLNKLIVKNVKINVSLVKVLPTTVLNVLI
jgi:hypothetical protein